MDENVGQKTCLFAIKLNKYMARVCSKTDILNAKICGLWKKKNLSNQIKICCQI